MSSVDVVIPCYNYARYLPQCVASVLGQEGVEVRALIIDDCSQDESEIVGRRLAEQDSRVEYRRHSINQGHIETYNEGLLDWASAEYSLLLSSDDALAPGALQRATRLLDQHSNIGMLYGIAVIIVDDSDYNLVEGDNSDDYQIIPSSSFIKHCFESGNPVPTPTAVVRTKLQHLLGGYRADLPHTGDMEMWMRFAVHSSIGVLSAVQAYYRWHHSNMSLQYFAGVLRDDRDVVITLRSFFKQWGAQFPECSYWYNSKVKRFGEKAFWIASKSLDNNDIEAFNKSKDFIKEFYPVILNSPAGWRLKAKRLLGKTLWNYIRPTLNHVRGIHEYQEPFIPKSKMSTGQRYGWWPETN